MSSTSALWRMMLMSSKAFRLMIRLNVYAGIATKIPAPVATKASLIAGAMTPIDAFEPSFENVSRIEITVPKSPINGEVEAIIESHVSPLVASLSAREMQTFSFSFVILPLAHFLSTEFTLTGFAPISSDSTAFSSLFCQLPRPATREIKIVKVMIK